MRWPRCTLACPDQSFGPAASPAGCPAATLCAGRLCCRLDRPRFAFSGWAWSRPIIAPRFSGPLGVLTRCRGPCAPLGFRLPSEFAVSRVRGGSPPLPVVPGGSPPAFLFGFRLGAAPRLFFVSLLRSRFLALPRVKCVPAMYLPNLIMSASTTSTRGCCSTWASSVRTMVTCGSPHTFVTRAMVPYGFHSSACVSVVSVSRSMT